MAEAAYTVEEASTADEAVVILSASTADETVAKAASTADKGSAVEKGLAVLASTVDRRRICCGRKNVLCSSACECFLVYFYFYPNPSSLFAQTNKEQAT